MSEPRYSALCGYTTYGAEEFNVWVGKLLDAELATSEQAAYLKINQKRADMVHEYVSWRRRLPEDVRKRTPHILGNYDVDRLPDRITFTLKSVFVITRAYRIPQKRDAAPELKPEHRLFDVISQEQSRDKTRMDAYTEAFQLFGIPMDFSATEFHWRVDILY
ncbi:hypothetical protein BKA70DRAFT_1402379 [Coprinopsis sp. MPI-PUGE-AT-0042]|nr:hypothetical protein BKA70DRAFT_1402379 [Coprinopsis sp. MPI-PUGE-AT-0042]